MISAAAVLTSAKSIHEEGAGDSVMRILILIVLVALLAVGVDVWVLLWRASSVAFGSPVLLGILIGVTLALLVMLPLLWWDRRGTPGDPAAPTVQPRPVLWPALVGGGVTGSVVLLMILAVRDEAVPPLTAATVLICGALTAAAAVKAFQAIARGDSVSFNSYWGGLGGGQGGWRVSPVTTLIVLSLIFLAATVTVATARGQIDPVAAGASKSQGESAKGAKDKPETKDDDKRGNAGGADGGGP